MRDLFQKETAEEPKQLRPHQARAIEMCIASMRKGNRRVVIQGPTGFGKTLVAAKIVASALAKGNKSIFTAPAISLIDQTVEAFELEGIRDIGVMQANHPRTNAMASMQICSVQTLARRKIPEASLVLVDECHIRSSVIDKMMDEREDLFFVGLSATPWAKGMGLRWQDLAIPVTLAELIEQGYLSKFRVLAPHIPDLSKVRTSKGDYVETDLEKIMSDRALVAGIVETWLEHGQNRPTLLFGVNRAHAFSLAMAFEKAGVATAYCDAFTDLVERKVIERRFRSGEVKVACSVRTLTTGIDWPVSCIIDAAPTQSEMLHVQKIGRGLRVNPGTEDLVILDHASNTTRLGFVTDIRHTRLDRTEPGQKQPTARPPRLPLACSSCGTLHTGLQCPYCGKERVRPAGVEIFDGELRELDGRGKKVPTREEKQRFWSMALWLDDQRGRERKLALGLYKGKFGVWPRGLSDELIPADWAFMNYEKSRRIAYAKGKQRAAERGAQG